MLNIKPKNLFLVVFNLRYFNLPRFQASHISLFTRGYIVNVYEYDSFRFFYRSLNGNSWTFKLKVTTYKQVKNTTSLVGRFRWEGDEYK